jgi:hypothetical protein
VLTQAIMIIKLCPKNFFIVFNSSLYPGTIKTQPTRPNLNL